MLLSAWLAREGITQKRFAEMIGASQSHITGICDGTSWPSRKLIRAIKRETGDEVTSEDFVNLGSEAA